MILRLRVSFPDRPGALGQVARVLGTLGADILQVTVLERETGRAVDDFIVSCPGAPDAEAVRDRLPVVPGLRVEGVWPTRETPGAAPDYDLLRHVAADPSRAYPTLVDAVPGLVGAEWAVAVSAGGELVHRSWQAPDTLDETGSLVGVKIGDLASLRPSVLTSGPYRLMSLPVPGAALHVVLARTEGPPFHRAEVDRANRVLEIVSIMAASA
ncbi:amino acid-binding protein [Planobispora rosea]|uniref:Amino acid-binding protein n=1 Tax=Planobispora rosea TaxID=35762 RepID=A0A8J3S0V1_PLARO|nr:ACT domain-containing protein [Planobispora rosea]GGS48653.1 amino acid-binding protein [Planobispora rosea]GIH83697.1 amino acid-binding protein [Planobispora rosea]